MSTMATSLATLPGAGFARTLIARRTLLYQMVRRDFEQRFVGSAAGWLWGIIHPLVLLASWTFVFQVCLKVQPPAGALTQNYTVFLFCGYLPWMLFQETVQRSTSAVLEQSNLITKTLFPSELVPVSVFLSAMVSHFMALALVLAMVIFWVHTFSPMVFFLPVYMLLLGMLAVGLGWIFSAIQVYVRDTAQVVIVILTAWFWATPIFIGERQFPERVRFLLTLNPMAYIVRAYRERLLSDRLPDPRELAILALFCIVTFVAGGLLFRHLKSGFADVL
jgi:lipopolysaccharide transport system permease protein